MASNSSSQSSESTSHEDLAPALRKRLAQLFQYGADKSKQGDHDYAHSMFAQCVVRDPSNLMYVEAMFDNLKLKYEGKKKKCKVKENRAPFKKALHAEEWRKVLKLGPNLLKDNPWDVPTLRGMAQACEALHFNEVELRYLRNALDANPKNIEVNRHCASSLARMGQFDQAIACWHRIEEDLKSEAQKNITDLTMEKTRHAHGIVDDDAAAKSGVVSKAKSNAQKAKSSGESSPSSNGDKPGDKPGGSADTADTQPGDADDAGGDKSTGAEASSKEPDQPTGDSQRPKPISRTLARPPEPEKPPTVADLEHAITKEPEEVAHYLRLAEMHDAEGRFREAEQVLRRALPVSGGDLTVRERLEKAQIRRSKAYLAKAEHDAKDNPSEKSKEHLEKARRQHNRLELDVYSARADRYPDDLAVQYEVGVRLKRVGNFEEAAKYFQKSKADERCRGSASLAAGECLQQMRQYTAALQAYEDAADAALSKESETYRLALYRAGVLATGLKDPERAKKWLKMLVAADPDYRDAAARLDKLG